MITDARFAFRQLFKSPGFTLLALITLALGIGLNTAIYSLIDDLFLRGLPYAEPERIVHMFGNWKDRNVTGMPVSAPRFMQYRPSTGSGQAQSPFSEFAAENFTAFTMTGVGDPVQVF